jgi:protocatechuate 3,4-dioxygenase beta subunit
MRHRKRQLRLVFIIGCIGALATLTSCAGSAAPPAEALLPNPAASQGLEGTTQAGAASAMAQAECAAPAEASPAMTEGPYFKAGSPQRSSLIEASTVGEKLVLTGFVLSVDCKPIANALLDFWQADGNGVYDNTGYGLRGHQFTDGSGRYMLTTVVPGLYPGRTEHIHVKVQPPGGTALTTQLFFPGVRENVSDPIFDKRLVISMEKSSDGWQGEFSFVVK